MPDRRQRLLRASTELLAQTDLQRILDAIVEALCDITAADAASISLVNEDRTYFDFVASKGLSDRYLRTQHVTYDAGAALYKGPQQHLLVDLARSPVGDAELFRSEGLAKVLALPLVKDDAVIGSLNGYLKMGSPEFDEEDIDLAHILAAQASIAIANARLFDDLRREQEEKERFLSIVSHELRTPLTPLKAIAQLLIVRVERARNGAALDLEALERNLHTIERQVDRMNGLVTDLLSVSRAGRGVLEMDRRPFDLAESVRDAVAQYRAATREEGRHEFALETPPSLVVTADEARIEQVLMNLIGNAVKYSPRGGTVRVSLAQQDGAARVTIADEGIGVPPEDLPRLGAAAFTRGTGKAATFAGMGIGLHVAKLVVEAHGGSLSIASEGEDKGTTVEVTLPL